MIKISDRIKYLDEQINKVDSEELKSRIKVLKKVINNNKLMGIKGYAWIFDEISYIKMGMKRKMG